MIISPVFKSTHTIAQRISNPQNNIQIPIVEHRPAEMINLLQKDGNKLFSALWIKELICCSYITSLPEVPIPNIPDSATEAESTTIATDALWKSPRFDLSCWISPVGRLWTKAGTLPLQNSGGYPYVRQKLLDIFTDALALEVGKDGAIAISIADAGWGMPSSNDYISVYGSYSYEYQLLEIEPPSVTTTEITTVTVDDTIDTILSANAKRTELTFTNLGQERILLHLTNAPQIGQHDAILDTNQAWTAPHSWKGAVHAETVENFSNLKIREVST